MPSLRQVGVDTVYADTPCVSDRDCTAPDQINGGAKEKKNPAAKRNATYLNESTTSNAMPKKAMRSILEQLNYGGEEEEEDEEDVAESNDDSPSREKENTLNAQKKDKTKKKNIKKEPSKKKSSAASAKTGTDKTSAKKRTIRDFYSLSPKADTSITPLGNTDASATTPTPKKATTKSVALNEDAEPLIIHVPFIGLDKYASTAIKQHCVESKYDVGESPVVLTGKYHHCMMVPIERFLEGFGRYIH